MSFTSSRLLKVVILGDANVGKTAILTRYVHKKFVKYYRPTVGLDFLTKQVVLPHGGRRVTLQLWDTAGQERYWSLGGSFFRGADCCVLVCDVTKQKSFDNLDAWIQEFANQLQLKPSEVLKFPFVLLANKVDNDIERVVTEKQLESWCQLHSNMKYFETSAKLAVNVDQAFEYLAEVTADKKYPSEGSMILKDKYVKKSCEC